MKVNGKTLSEAESNKILKDEIMPMLLSLCEHGIMAMEILTQFENDQDLTPAQADWLVQKVAAFRQARQLTDLARVEKPASTRTN